tara:strand:+ start:9292 stop:9912 length:621 start_codon:yes stop_codon:yes gene_type:complete
MPYGYLGTTPNQQLKNSGVFSVEEALALQNVGELGGSLEHIETQTVSSAVSSVDFINLADNPYEVYFLQVNNIKTSATSQARLRFSNDNGSSFISTGYEYANFRLTTGGSAAGSNNTNHAQINTNLLSDTTSSVSANGYFYLYDLVNSSKYSFATYHVMGDYSPDTRTSFGVGLLPTAEVHNAFTIQASSGNLTSATMKLYGIKEL